MKISTSFLQVAVLLAGGGALAFLILMPQAEGRNAHATSYAQIYLHDPFLAFAYLASTPFFVALWQAFRVLGLVRQGRAFSPEAVKALRTARLCGLAMIGFALAGEVLLFSNLFGAVDPSDDRAGGVAMGAMIAFGSALIAAMAAVCETLARDGGAMTRG